MQEQIERIINELCQALQAHYGEELEQIILFGSQARKDATSASDIDVMAVLKGTYTAPFLEYQNWNGWVADVLLEDQELLNLVFTSKERFDSARTPLYLNIRQEGIVIYERRNSMAPQ